MLKKFSVVAAAAVATVAVAACGGYEIEGNRGGHRQNDGRRAKGGNAKSDDRRPRRWREGR